MSDIITWNIDPGQYAYTLTETSAIAIEGEIASFAESLTDEITSFMKANARWEDDTGAARAGLYSDVEHIVRQAVYILMSHDVTLDYVWFLEYAHRGRFGILADTADHFWPVFQRGVAEIVARYSG